MAMTRIEDGIQDTEPIRFLELLGLDEEDLAGYSIRLNGSNPEWGKWRTFRSITLPLLKPTLLLGAVLLSVAYLQFFEESFVMTQGGPLDSTLSAAYYVYQKFGFGQYGIASAASWVLFIIIALVSVLQFRILKED